MWNVSTNASRITFKLVAKDKMENRDVSRDQV